ncbi:MAG: phosphate ABC transporter substrate-binding protein [Butyrivibrio sp.]|nr:phosphate ABC transporter substrate-binding protein [Butyrivibrio sp.]MCR4904417.1 phosphate ABC transporter substrate-binding protein [Butyrivibrio sp.]
MRNKFVKTMIAGITAVMMMGSLAGCGSSSATATENTASQEDVVESKAAEETVTEESAEVTDNSEETSSLSGSITLAGSTSMEKLCEAMSESFMEANPEVTVTVEYTGSSAGIESLIQGSTNIGNASRGLKDAEKESGAVENIVAIDGIAVITDKDNSVSDLTTEQLVSIYKGELTNWSELGGSDEAIVVIGREAGSGTRGAFEELLEVEDACTYAQELDSTGAVLAKVASTKGAIGYISLDAVSDEVLSIALNGIAATEENIVSGQYMLSRPFVMATLGEIDAQSELVKAWFEYIKSDKGQEVISTVGLILPE